MTNKFIHFPEMLGAREFYIRDDLVKKIVVLPDDTQETGQNIHCNDGVYFAVLKHNEYILHQITDRSALQSPRVSNGGLHDFACKVSDMLWGGELGWTRTGLDGMFNELKKRLSSPRVPADKEIQSALNWISDSSDIIKTNYPGRTNKLKDADDTILAIHDTIRTALRLKQVKTIQDLDSALTAISEYNGKIIKDWQIVLDAARAYAELQKGV